MIAQKMRLALVSGHEKLPNHTSSNTPIALSSNSKTISRRTLTLNPIAQASAPAITKERRFSILI